MSCPKSVGTVPSSPDPDKSRKTVGVVVVVQTEPKSEGPIVIVHEMKVSVLYRHVYDALTDGNVPMQFHNMTQMMTGRSPRFAHFDAVSRNLPLWAEAKVANVNRTVRPWFW